MQERVVNLAEVHSKLYQTQQDHKCIENVEVVSSEAFESEPNKFEQGLKSEYRDEEIICFLNHI